VEVQHSSKRRKRGFALPPTPTEDRLARTSDRFLIHCCRPLHHHKENQDIPRNPARDEWLALKNKQGMSARERRCLLLYYHIREAEPPSSDISNSETTLLSHPAPPASEAELPDRREIDRKGRRSYKGRIKLSWSSIWIDLESLSTYEPLNK
jgi:hypothetical protein